MQHRKGSGGAPNALRPGCNLFCFSAWQGTSLEQGQAAWAHMVLMWVIQKLQSPIFCTFLVYTGKEPDSKLKEWMFEAPPCYEH